MTAKLLFDDMDEAGRQAGGFVQPDPTTDFKLRSQQIAQRRALAERLATQAAASNGGSGMHGGVYMVGNQWGNVARDLGSAVLSGTADKAEAENALAQRMAQNDFSRAYGAAPDDQTRQTLLTEARDKGLKYDLESAFRKEEADRVERGEQAAAERQSRSDIAEANRIDQGEQRAADRVARADLRAMPTIHISQGGGRGGVKAPSGYRYNEDGTALEPIPGGPADKSNAPGKPLSAQQEKAALELGGQYATVQRLADSFKDSYSGDMRSTIERQFGNVAGGLAPQGTQDMTRWWADQAFMDELPQRHELFGAALTPTEQKSWASAAINPSLSPKVIKERFETRRSIMENALTRMRASAVAGGKSGQQFDAATGTGKPKPKKVGNVTVERLD